MTVKKKPSKTPSRSSRTRLDPQVWLERAQAMQVYSSALKEADEKVLKLFDTVSEQTKRYFEFNTRVYVTTIIIASIMLIASFILAVFMASDSLFFQIFSVIGLSSASILLIILLIRNPLKYARHMLEHTVRVNVVFLSFVRRLQQSDLALRFVFMQTQNQDFNKVHMQIQEFQHMVDQTSEEISQIMQDFGD